MTSTCWVASLSPDKEVRSSLPIHGPSVLGVELSARSSRRARADRKRGGEPLGVLQRADRGLTRGRKRSGEPGGDWSECSCSQSPPVLRAQHPDGPGSLRSAAQPRLWLDARPFRFPRPLLVCPLFLGGIPVAPPPAVARRGQAPGAVRNPRARRDCGLRTSTQTGAAT